MQNNNDLVSIITPFKNSIKYFQETYDSVMSQSYDQFEWFIIDDGSDTDQYSALLNLCKDARVKVLENNEEAGAGGARNTGLKHVSGKFITFIDSDDMWDKDFILNSISFINENEVNSCFSGYKRYLENKNQFMSSFFPSKIVSSENILRGCDISCLTFFGLSEYLKEDVKFGNYRARNDLYFFYHYLINSGDSHPNKSILATYRIGKKSISSNKIKLIKYQYILNRDVANNSLIKTIFNVVIWAGYGLLKYR
ncbi:glycosyltransferase family 2 protein [Vibrio harveyi]|uniref:glycosyltransferase family 2 protein n=1 Tax=Vibrio harveyi TaxID=669 RepID=UPI0039092DEE